MAAGPAPSRDPGSRARRPAPPQRAVLVRIRLLRGARYASRVTNPTRLLGAAVNMGLRAGMVGMTAAVVRAGPNDPRYRDKGIGSRMALLGPPSTPALPALWVRRRGPYPVWMDNLYLSIAALDLAGNVLDLYDGYTHFDLIPHAHGGGAVTVLAGWLLEAPML